MDRSARSRPGATATPSSSSRLPSKIAGPVASSTLQQSRSVAVQPDGHNKLRRKNAPGVSKPPEKPLVESRVAAARTESRPIPPPKSGNFYDIEKLRPTTSKAHGLSPSPVLAPVQSTSTFGYHQGSNTLRRKPSIIGSYVSHVRTSPQTEARVANSNRLNTVVDEESHEPAEDGAQWGSRAGTANNSSRANDMLNDRSAFQTPTPLSAPSATPSLIHSDSPGAFSHTTTATSQTSYSPLINASPHFVHDPWGSPSKPILAQPRTNKDRTTRLQQAPPELAHLLGEGKAPHTKQAPPRPSRENTPLLSEEILREVSRALPRLNTNPSQPLSPQSNIRTPSSAASSMPQQSPPSARPLFSPLEPPDRKSPAKEPHTKAGTAARAEATVRSPLSALPVIKASTSSTLPTASTKSSSKFGFFSRRPKAEDTPPPEDNRRYSRKGPTAGTGHEGYGKHAIRGRSSSAVSGRTTSSRGTSAGTSAGTSSRASSSKRQSGSSPQPDSNLDDFLLERVNPVYLRGGGSASANDIHTGFGFRGAKGPGTNSSVTSLDTSLTSQSSFEKLRDAPQRGAVASPSTSSQLKLEAPQQPGVKEQKKGSNPKASLPAYTQHYNTSESDIEETQPVSFGRSRALSPGSSQDGEPPKVKKSNWWNFFQKSQPTSTKKAPTEDSMDTGPDPSSVMPMAHYAMLETDDTIDYEHLAKIMQDAEAEQSDGGEMPLIRPPIKRNQSSLSVSERSTWSESEAPSVVSRGVLGTAPASIIQGPLAEEPLSQPAFNASEQRPSRLAQVGRIPKVVSTKTDHQRKMPDRSFSRPFAASQPRPSLDATSPADAGLAIKIRSAVATTAVPRPSEEEPSNLATSDVGLASPQEEGVHGPQNSISTSMSTGFFTFQRKDSEMSYSSSSGGYYFPIAASTAVVPATGAPLSSDEVWDEFDDLIDEVWSPATPRQPKPTEQEDTPKAKPVVKVERVQSSPPREVAPEQQQVPSLASMAGYLRRPSGDARSSGSTLDSASNRGSAGTNPNRRSKSRSRNSAEGDTPVALSNRSSMKGSARDGSSGGSSAPSSATAVPSRPTSDSDNVNAANKQKKARRPNSHKYDPRSMANLRFGALMTSKWLSFGRVLFSPAHDEVKNPAQDRVLVIDGLGKDWSYFCALTYSEANVYSLGPSASSQPSRNSLGPWQTLPNHRHFSHPSLDVSFPFPKSFFAAVVFRFPISITEATLKTAVSECKRVLRPGGHFEICALDMDLTNTGVLTRKALRDLKTRIHEANADVCLKPVPDNVQRLLGRRGFENINRCIVGVPVAGSIPSSRENSCDGSAAGDNYTELMRDQTDENDQGITKMVAKVGRWWYTMCHEAVVLPDGSFDGSIWSDMKLLRECEEWQTKFKLFICYAQKPTVTRRRTVSL